MTDPHSDDKALAERVVNVTRLPYAFIDKVLPEIAQHTGPLRERIAELQADAIEERRYIEEEVIPAIRREKDSTVAAARADLAAKEAEKERWYAEFGFEKARADKAEADIAEAVRLLGRIEEQHLPTSVTLRDAIRAFLARPEIAAVGREGEPGPSPEALSAEIGKAIRGEGVKPVPADIGGWLAALAREEGPGEKAERIVAAAIREDYAVYTAPHHHQIFRYVAAMRGTPIRGGEQGFITSTGRFVSRVEGGRIARQSGQMPKDETGGVLTLFSEQLWEVTDYAFAGLEPGERRHEFKGCGVKGCASCYVVVSDNPFAYCDLPASAPVHLTGEEIAKKLHAESLARMPPIDPASPYLKPAPVHAVAETHKFRRSGIVGDLWCGTCGNGPTHPVHAVEPPAPEKRCTCKAGGLGGHWLGCPVLDPPAAPQDEKPKGGE